MKKITMMLVMVLVALTASAQNTLRENGTFTLQPKVGVGFGSFSGSWSGARGIDTKVRVGLIAGVEGEYYVNSWFSAAVGVNYAQQGWKFEGNGAKSTTKLDYLNVPIVANFYVTQGLALKTGVQMGFLMNAKEDGADIKDAYKKLNVSIPIGISGEYRDFVFDARYNIAVTKLNKNGSNSERSDLFTLTLGYKFEL